MSKRLGRKDREKKHEYSELVYGGQHNGQIYVGGHNVVLILICWKSVNTSLGKNCFFFQEDFSIY